MVHINDYLDLPGGEVICAHEGEILAEHANLVMYFYRKLGQENGLYLQLDKIIAGLRFQNQSLPLQERETIRRWFEQAIYLHDLGKINPAYQRIKLNNNTIYFIDRETDHKHSLLSALLYLHLFLPETDEVEDDELRGFMRHVLYVFAYVISRHHTFLKQVSGKDEKFYTKLKDLLRRVTKHQNYIRYYTGREDLCTNFDLSLIEQWARYDDEHEPFSFYILTKLLYSTLVASDFYATYTHTKNGQKPEFQYFTKQDISKLDSSYKRTELYQGIQAYKKNGEYFIENPINALRSDIFLDAETELLKSLDKNIFYLEAPTGGGKTNVSINLALRLLENDLGVNKLIYVFPFNTLVDQTKESLDKIFPQEIQNEHRMQIINSITPIVSDLEKKEEEDLIDYQEEVLRRQMLQYPITITSHVNFFNYLFGTGRESNLAFTHLCNSVVILDEIQSYRNDIWTEIIHFLNAFSEFLNIKIIIMSATLPKLDRLLGENEVTAELLPNCRRYYENPLFRNRVQVNYDLLDKGKVSIEELQDYIVSLCQNRGPSRMLIEFINKKSARLFYQKICNHYQGSVPVIELTGDDHRYYRQKVIAMLNEKDADGIFVLKDVIVVATQVIEAGVDIDMDIGCKDISLLDAEEQLMGRINRSCLREDCWVYFFDMDNAKPVYRHDFRLEKDLNDKNFRQLLRDKHFGEFYRLVLQRLKEHKSERNDNHIDVFLNKVGQLDFQEIAYDMELIEDTFPTLFINYTFQLDDGSTLVGQEIWEQFKELIYDREMEYAERRVRLSTVQEKMSFFIFSYRGIPKMYDDRIGEIYYVLNGELMMENDPLIEIKKFSTEKYREASEGLWL